MKALLPLLALGLVVIGCQPAAEQTAITPQQQTDPANITSPGGTATTVVYSDVRPIFEQQCIGCHGDKPADGIDLRTYESIMKGGEHGTIVSPGSPEDSLLIHSLRGLHGAEKMPMGAAALTEEQIKLLESWIEAGAQNDPR
jgi:mono/diheme cytochrome c family protein